MAYPPAYERTFSFTDFETTNPGEPKPGDKIDAELDDVSNALTATQANLALIQRADGQLSNGSVGADQLDPTLFDHIADDAVADAEAAAAAAASSASAAAGSATSASASATSAAISDANAAGSAAQAGVSQGIAQIAADDASAAADDAEDFADAAELAANTTSNSVAEAQLHEETAFKWAEYLAGPVAPAPPGWPEAVDDGMFSSKWWAIRARDYNTTYSFDFGTAGADIGEAFDIWNAIPGNDLPPGQVYAKWGTPPHTYVLTDPSDPSDPASWTDTTGGPGPAGPPNSLTIGTVVSGTPAAATITGTSPNQVLSLTIPPGATGATGPTGPTGATGAAGPPNTLNIGTVTTGAPGSAAAATITGAPPSQTLSLTIPRGDVGATGATGATGPAGPTNYANPTALIGLTAVNGSLANTMRSDAAPALDQSIAPTWLGDHAFNALVNLAGPVQASGIDGISGQVLSSQGTGLPATWRTPGGGAIEILWNFSTSVGTANPGSQKMSLNSAVYTAVTTAVFNSLAQTNFDANAILGLLQAGNRIYMQQRNDATKAVIYQVTGTATNLGGYWTVPVTHINSLGAVMFAANVDIVCVFIMSASTSTSFGNPTASVGTTVINGSASTAMRSDAAPSLNVAINPVWTGVHNWGSAVGQSTAPAIIRSRVNAFEWGHSNAAGYGSTLGFGRANGRPFLAFNAEHGTTDNTFRTRGIIGRILQGDATGSLLIGRAATASADDQALTTDVTIAANGGLFMTGATGGSQGAGTINATNLYINGVAISAGAAAANPTGTVGLAVVNGVATTFMRSDAAPPIDQAIAPTWTGTHVFANGSGQLLLRNTVPATDAKNTLFRVDTAGNFSIVSSQDATPTTGMRALITATRALHAWTALAFGNTFENLTYNFQGTGLVSVGGSIVVGAPTGGDKGVGTVNATGLYVNGVAVGGGAAGANPTGTIGLTAVNGSAGTFLRSDGAPALSQAIAPTWSATHIFSKAGSASTTAPIIVTSATPVLYFKDTDGAADRKNARVYMDAGAFNVDFQNDAESVTRAGINITWNNAVVAVNLGNATDNPTFNFLGVGALTVGGAVFQVSAAPQWRYTESDQATDEKSYTFIINGKVLLWRMSNDAFSAHSNFLSVTRGTGIAVASMALGNATDNPTYSFLGTGTFTVGGAVSAPSYTSTSSRAIKRETGKPSRVRAMLARLRPLLYQLLDGDDREQLGLIAEEVHEVCPQLSDGKAVAYDRLAILLLAAWQEEHAEAA